MNTTKLLNKCTLNRSRTLAGLLVVAGWLLGVGQVRAQLLSGQSSDTAQPAGSGSSIVSAVAISQGLSPIAASDLPRFQAYMVASYRGVFIPYPCPPQNPVAVFFLLPNGAVLVDPGNDQVLPPNLLTGQMATSDALNSAIAAEVSAIGNLINQSQAQAQAAQFGGPTTMGFGQNGPLLPGGGSGGDTGIATNYPVLIINSNLLYLTLTNVDNEFAYCGLGCATDQVYAILESSSLSIPLNQWTVVAEVWPTDTNLAPFTVQTQNQGTLFLSAVDWTGISSDGNQTPLWWLWLYYGNAGLGLSDNDLDSIGANTLLYDYQNGLDPNVIQFSLVVTNNFVNTITPQIGLNVTAGFPGYCAVSVDDTNYSTDADWQPYTGTNVTANLGLTQGWHDVWVGLKGWAADATIGWEYQHLKLDWTPPILVVTSPTNGIVTTPTLQLLGYSPEELRGINYDMTNAAGLVTTQPLFVTSQCTDTNTGEFSTNYFQGYDIPLTNGVNIITLRATDMAGNVSRTNLTLILDYSSATNPPLVQINWPQNGTQISGTNFTLDGQLDNPTTLVAASVMDTNGNTNTFSGAVERDGRFWVEGIPLSAGTNTLTLTASDAAGNITVTNISVIQTSITLTMDDVTPDSQLWQPTVNLTGTISDSSYAVWVNGTKGLNNGDGTWSAKNVPTTAGGTASFTIIGYAPTEQQPDGSYGNQR